MINITRLLCILLIIIIISAFGSPVKPDGEVKAQPWIRAAITTGASSLSVTASGPSRISQMESSETLASYDNTHTYSFERSGELIRLAGSNDKFKGFSIICTDDSGRLQYNNRSYRRIARVVVWKGKLACINVLPLEEYLWGVVPCEVPSDWPMEALKTQAVAARTYSLRALEQYPERPFDVYSSVVDQVYRGSGGERDRTTLACRETSGIVCTYDGTPIIAYFHAAAGGWTASGAEMFGRDLPYLMAVPSRDSSVHRWTYRITTNNLASALRNAGYSVGAIQRVWVNRFSHESRVDEIKIVHSNGVLVITGPDLRRTLGPANIQSTYFTIEGQSVPEIPDESDYRSIESRGALPDPMEHYSISHPQVVVPLPSPALLETCFVLSSAGSGKYDSFVVIGAHESIEYVGGYIWVAKPVQVRDLDKDRIEDTFLFESEDISNPRRHQVIDDPGGDVGTPRNGSFLFVGHGCGHGVGMSQHGARILAESGHKYEEILKYFYSGIEIERFW